MLVFGDLLFVQVQFAVRYTLPMRLMVVRAPHAHQLAVDRGAHSPAVRLGHFTATPRRVAVVLRLFLVVNVAKVDELCVLLLAAYELSFLCSWVLSSDAPGGVFVAQGV